MLRRYFCSECDKSVAHISGAMAVEEYRLPFGENRSASGMQTEEKNE
jgi:hypothetical protein